MCYLYLCETSWFLRVHNMIFKVMFNQDLLTGIKFPDALQKKEGVLPSHLFTYFIITIDFTVIVIVRTVV